MVGVVWLEVTSVWWLAIEIRGTTNNVKSLDGGRERVSQTAMQIDTAGRRTGAEHADFGRW